MFVTIRIKQSEKKKKEKGFVSLCMPMREEGRKRKRTRLVKVQEMRQLLLDSV